MLSKTMLIGRLGNAPESKATGTSQVTRFSLATSEKRSVDGEIKEFTEWHKVVLFGKLAELAARYLKKGHKVYIEGKNQTRSWEKDGHTHYITEVIANQMQFLENKESGEVPNEFPF